MLKSILMGAKSSQSSPLEYNKYVDIRNIPNVTQFKYDANGEFVPPIEFSSGYNEQLYRAGSNDWGIKLKLLTTSTGIQHIIGNLNDGNGTFGYFLSINNTHQQSCKVLFAINLQNMPIYLMFFGIGSQKWPTNVWHDLEFRITDSVASCTLNDTQFTETYELPSATDHPVVIHPNTFYLGKAVHYASPSGSAYEFQGKFKDIQMFVGR